MVTCSIKGCHKQARIFKKKLGFCDEHWSMIGAADTMNSKYSSVK